MKERINWLDNLRTFLIFLVIVIHAALIYEQFSIGAAWWVIIDPYESNLAGILFIIFDAFVMVSIFFISGYFIPPSLKKKGAKKFIIGKLKRIVLPWLIAALTLLPAYKWIFLNSRGLPQEHWTTYFHWTNGIWSQNWLWFLPTLFTFYIFYLLFAKKIQEGISLKKALWFTLLISWAFSILMYYFNLHGWIKTIFFEFQNERILIYFMFFLLGAVCNVDGVLSREWKSKKLSTWIHSTAWIPINGYIFFIIYYLIVPDGVLITHLIDVILFRLCLVFMMGYMLYAMIQLFRKFFNKEVVLGKELNANSYYVYIIHVIVMGVISLSMLGTSIPGLVKLLISISGTFIVSNLLVLGFRIVKKKIFILLY